MSTYQDALIEAALDFHAHEMDIGGDARWERWIEKACGILDLPLDRGLDGDEADDGFCLDLAYDAFLSGTSAKHYAASVKAKPQFGGRS